MCRCPRSVCCFFCSLLFTLSWCPKCTFEWDSRESCGRCVSRWKFQLGWIVACQCWNQLLWRRTKHYAAPLSPHQLLPNNSVVISGQNSVTFFSEKLQFLSLCHVIYVPLSWGMNGWLYYSISSCSALWPPVKFKHIRGISSRKINYVSRELWYLYNVEIIHKMKVWNNWTFFLYLKCLHMWEKRRELFLGQWFMQMSWMLLQTHTRKHTRVGQMNWSVGLKKECYCV